MTHTPMNELQDSLKSAMAAARETGFRRHRSGEAARRVVQGLSDALDEVLRSLFRDVLAGDLSRTALLAVGGYGRRELCPFSDVDIMFLTDGSTDLAGVERMVRAIWDSGLELGHSVRTPEEALKFMAEDDVTAAALLEGRQLAGSEGLMRRFHETRTRYGKRHGEAFIQSKMAQLRRSIESPDRTIFVNEPNLKEGPCCLRDIQQIGWIERMRRGVLSIEEMALRGDFSHEEVRRLVAAYEFYLRGRCELHFSNNLRQDLLSQDLLADVTRGLGYCERATTDPDAVRRGAERLMSEYYRHASAVLHFARYYLESGSQGTKFLPRIRQALFSSRVSSFLSLYDGRLYLTSDVDSADLAPERVLSVFQVALSRDVDLSEILASWIRRYSIESAQEFAHSREVNIAFVQLLSGRGPVGRILTRLHETGVLARVIPEFQGLTSLVNFDGHHQFTVDEHTLRTLRELDAIEGDLSYSEREFVKVLSTIHDRLSLRLALLLHDVGKAVPGKHDATGTEAAVVIGERLGLDAPTIETVEFLIYHHLAMFRFSQRTDCTEDRVVESFAALVGTPERLAMLYLLTYIDIRSVGPGTWTSWKGAQLADLYARTRTLLETGSPPETRQLDEVLELAGVAGERKRRILEHCVQIDSRAYERETIPERMGYHLDLVDQFLRSGSSQVGLDAQLGYSEITFATRDRPHLFADFAGLLLSEGLNILGARIFSRRDGVAIDLFQVEIADRTQVPIEERVENLRRKLEVVEREKGRVADLVVERARRYRAPPPRPVLAPPRVQVDNESSRMTTVVEVDAGDRTGLLYDLATTLSDLGLDVRAAKVSTLVDRAHDVFFVVEPGKGKILEPALIRRIEESLAQSAAQSLTAQGLTAQGLTAQGLTAQSRAVQSRAAQGGGAAAI